MLVACIAIVGGGHMAARHLQALRQEGHTLVALIDPAERPFVLDQNKDVEDVHLRNFKELPVDSADALIIATSANHRLSLLQKGLEHGIKHFVIEKPFSQSVIEGRQMHALARKYGARVVVNHGRRYCPNVTALKELESSGRLGSLRMISLRMGGGALGCVGTHWIDLCINLMQAIPQQVACMTTEPLERNVRGDTFFDPGGTVLLIFPGSRRAHIDQGDDVGIMAGADFVFELGKVSWQAEADDWTLHERNVEDTNKPLTLYGLPLERSIFPSTPPDIIAYAREALRDALSIGPITSGIPEAISTIEVYTACRLAAAEQRVVSLPLARCLETSTFSIP